jgi:hypothetical protein
MGTGVRMMNTTFGLRVAVLGILVIVSSALVAQTTTSAPSGLQSTDLQQRKTAVERLVSGALAERAAAIRQFVAVIEASPEESDLARGSAKALALEALGTLRAREELPLLMREMGCVETWPGEPSPVAGRPAIRALIRIGLPAVEALLAPGALEHASERTLDMTSRVVRYVFPNAATARAFVEAYDPGYSEAARKNRDALVKLITALPKLRDVR